MTRFCFVCIVLLAFSFQSYSQALEFIENKGQWNEKVKFKSDMGGSVFFLQQTGYRVRLNKKEDLEKIAESYSGHVHGKDGKAVSSTSALSLTTAGTPNNKTNFENNGGTQSPVVLHSHAYEVNFLNASANAVAVPDKPLDTYNNYFIGNDSSKWASGCSIYYGITYKNMYPGIDVRYYSDRGNLKYDIIVNPNADISKLALQFDGVNGLAVKNGNLIIKTSLGDVSELTPYSYQFDAKGKTEVAAKYVVEGNVVRFKLGSYSKNATLVIDPTLIFSSFSASISDNWGFTATYDGAGNFYGGGISFGTGFPVSPGAFQETFGGGVEFEGTSGYDIALIKLTPNGFNRVYATYIGGSGNEQPHSLIVDNAGDLVIAGRTNSANYPTTVPTYGSGGGFDIILTILNPTGTALVGSRKIGGSGSDGLNIQQNSSGSIRSLFRNYGDDARSEVIVDKDNNIYLASCTQSSNFPVTPGASQSTSGGAQDGVVIKASSNLSNILFSTYLGGSGDDAAFVLSINPTNNNIYVAGGTTSNNLRGTGGVNGPVLYSEFSGGACDGFVSILNNTGTTLVKTVYVASANAGSDDVVYGIQFDRKGFPYITGTTTVAFPLAGNPAFNSQSSGKQFITKMQPTLNGVVYSTNFGKSGNSVPDISPTAFLVDRCENVYVAGWGGGLNLRFANAGTQGLITTPDAIRATSDGSDFYFFILEKNALSQLYGTFFGNIDPIADVGDHVDGGTSRFDSEGIIYEALCANCQKVGTFPTAPASVWGRVNPAQSGAECNLAMVKIAFEFAGVGSAIRSSIGGVPRDTAGCVPLTVDFTDTIGNAQKYIWNFGDGSPDTTTLTANASHTFNTVGKFRVRLISIDSNTCNIADTSYITIKVGANKANLAISVQKLDPCEALLYQFNNNSTAPPDVPFGPLSFEWSFGDGTTQISNQPTLTHSYAAPGTYTVVLRLIDTAYCNYPDSIVQTLRVAVNVDALFETPASGCAPYTAVFTNSSIGGAQFTWDFGDGTTSTDENPVHTFTTPGTYTVRMIASDPNTCNKIDSTRQTIIVSASPTAAFTFSPQVPKENQEYTFTNLSIGAIRYKWDFGDGDTIVTTKIDTTIKHTYSATGTFNVCLTATNQYGCDSTVCAPISAIIVPLVDVPNAFTPNGDGTNDIVRVRGFGIAKMDWRIYNRWGTMIFRGTTIKEAWDGKYNGVLQPQEVYVYVLDVTFSDGTKYRKSGDITLLR